MSKNMYGLPNHIYLVLGGFKYTSDPNGLIANVLDEPAVQQALRNHYFDSLGLPRLHVSVQA